MSAPAHNLHVEIEATRALLANYRDILADDEEAQADMVEGETNLHDAIRRALVRVAEIKAMCEGIEDLATRLGERRARLQQQDKSLRVALCSAMELAGLKRLETDVATISRKATPPAVVITAEAEIPSTFWKKQDPKLDMRALLAALKEADEAGKTIPGAVLSNGGETVSIR
jgi:hypothetical protein